MFGNIQKKTKIINEKKELSYVYWININICAILYLFELKRKENVYNIFYTICKHQSQLNY